MTKEAVVGLQVDFQTVCPYLKEHKLKKPIGFFFETENNSIVASETACPNGGLPGVEKRSESGFLVRINSDTVVAYCDGCPFLPEGFEKTLDADE